MSNDQDAFLGGLVVGVIVIAAILGFIWLATHSVNTDHRWGLYVECVESEKASLEFCAEAYNAPVKGE